MKNNKLLIVGAVIVIIIIIGILLFYFFRSDKEYSFIGTVITGNETGVIIEPDKDEQIRKSADKISIKLPVGKVIKIGDRVKVYYTGEVMESYPAQITLIDIVKIQED